MGLFGKIKENFNHGGVKVDLQAPASISMQDATMPVTVSITNTGDQPHTVNKVSVEIIATSRNQSFNTSSSQASSSSPETKTVARAENVQPFIIAPSAIQSVQLSITMNTAATLQEQLPQDGAMAQVAGAIQKLQSVSNAMNQTSYTYTVQAVADVEGITFDPSSDNLPLQILKPGQIGGASNFRIGL